MTCRWWSAGGAISSADTTFSGKLMEWANGQQMGGSYQEPDSMAKHDVSITFPGNGAADLVWNGTTYKLQRFSFGAMP